MPKYVLRGNNPKHVCVDSNLDIVFKPGITTETRRYVNLDKNPELKKVSDEPFISDLLVLENVSSPIISKMQDFYRTVTLRVSGKASVGSKIKLALLIGDTDNIDDFNVIRRFQFNRVLLMTGIESWESFDGRDDSAGYSDYLSFNNVVQNLDMNFYKFYYLVVTEVSTNVPISVYEKRSYLK